MTYPDILQKRTAKQLQQKRKHIDTVDLAVEINGILSEYVRLETPTDEDTTPKRFDISKDIKTIKAVSVHLLEKLKAQIAHLDHWTNKAETKAVVTNLIRDTLWDELPESYDVCAIQTCHNQIYEYVYIRHRAA